VKERFKEWLLRWLIRDLIRRRYGVHLMTVIVGEYLDCFYEDNLFTIHSVVSAQVDQAVERVRIGGDPLL
jgi:hypothetical protein